MPAITDVKTNIDLPTNNIPVTVSLESDGVSFVSFVMELYLKKSLIRAIEPLGTEKKLGDKYSLEDAITLKGLTFSCRGVVGSTVPGTINLHCVFTCGDDVIRSGVAKMKITAASSSQIFRFTCPFV